MSREQTPAPVPGGSRGRQAGEDPWEKHGVERGVWAEAMLETLEKGVKRSRWFSLIDKVASGRALGITWGKVQSNAEACGVDGTTVRHFARDSQKRRLAVKEQIRGGGYQPRPVRRVHIPKAGSSGGRPPREDAGRRHD